MSAMLTPRGKRAAKPHRPVPPAARTASPPGSWIVEAGGGSGTGGGGGGGGDGAPATTVTDVVGQDTGPRYLDKQMGSHTVVKLTPTMADPTKDCNVTFWLQFGDGLWVRQGVWLITFAHPSVTLGQQVIGTQGSPGAGNIWVPTDPKKRTWKVAAIEGNVASQDPPAAAPQSTFDVPPVGAVLPTSCKNIHFVPNPANGDPIVYTLNGIGDWIWQYYEIDWTQPTQEEDGNYWFSFCTVQKGYEDAGGVWHPAPDYEGRDESTLYPGRKFTDQSGSENQTGGNPVLGSTVKVMGDKWWTYPPVSNPDDGSPYPYRTFRFWNIAVSRLGTDVHGGDGVMTVQTGWPSNADHFDLHISAQPHKLDLSQVNPVTSFDPDSIFRGGAGDPLSVAVTAPLQVYDKALAMLPNSIDETWLKNGAVTAQKTALDAIDAGSGRLKADSVVCGLVQLPVSQLVYGSAIFAGDVYLTKGGGAPAIGLNNLGIWLFGAATSSVGGAPAPCLPPNNSVAGLMGNPWTNITNSQILLYGGDVGGVANSGPSTQLQATGIVLYAKNGDITTSPYLALQPTGLNVIAPKTFGVSLNPGQLVFTYDSAGTTWATPVTPAPNPRVLLTNTLSANGLKVLYQRIPDPGDHLMPSFLIQSNLMQQWTKDADSNYPCIGFQGNQMNLTYGPFTTTLAANMIQLQYFAAPLLSVLRLTTASLLLQQTDTLGSSTVTMASTSLTLGQTQNNSSVTLNNSGQALFTSSGTTTYIAGNVISTGQITVASGCKLGNADASAVCEIGVSTSDPALAIYGRTYTSSPGPSGEFISIRINGAARKLQIYSF